MFVSVKLCEFNLSSPKINAIIGTIIASDVILNRENNVAPIQIIIHVWLICSCKTPQRYDIPHYSFRCNIECKHIT